MTTKQLIELNSINQKIIDIENFLKYMRRAYRVYLRIRRKSSILTLVSDRDYYERNQLQIDSDTREIIAEVLMERSDELKQQAEEMIKQWEK